MEKYFYAEPNSWPRGPFSIAELENLKNDGTISDRTLVTRENEASWQPLGVVLGTMPAPPDASKPLTSTTRPAGQSVDLSGHFTGAGFSVFLLTFGQIAALVGFCLIIMGLVQTLSGLSEAQRIVETTMPRARPEAQLALRRIAQTRVFAVVSALAALCLAAALFIVYRRAKTLARVAAAQDFENARLWHAIDELRKRTEPEAETTVA